MSTKSDSKDLSRKDIVAQLVFSLDSQLMLSIDVVGNLNTTTEIAKLVNSVIHPDLIPFIYELFKYKNTTLHLKVLEALTKLIEETSKDKVVVKPTNAFNVRGK